MPGAALGRKQHLMDYISFDYGEKPTYWNGKNGKREDE